MARVYRQMPLNSIWEGSGNVMCLDVLRAMAKNPRCLEALAAELAPALGRDPRLDKFAAKLKDELMRPEGLESRARLVTENIALALQGALLLRFAPESVAGAFCASRLAGNRGQAFGTLAGDSDFAGILERAWPQ